MYYVVYDNFLNAEEYGIIKQYLGPGGGFPWKLGARINSNDESNDDMYFATMIYYSYHDGWQAGINRHPFHTITSKIHIESLFRIKSNLYFPSKTGKVEHHAPHRDSEFKHQGALFYLTTCDAPTTMADGTEIESIENRLLLFDPTSMHSSSSPTNAPFRVTINFNYFGAGVNQEYKDVEMSNPLPTIRCNEEKVEEIFNIKK
tara:strand:+ start:245 stop:853 length:609 start_codon:yes stop_codon:yes gene_type:complete